MFRLNRVAQGLFQVFAPLAWNPVRISVHRHSDRMVSELLLDISRAVVIHKKDCRIGVTQIVRRPSSHLGGLACAFECIADVILLDSLEEPLRFSLRFAGSPLTGYWATIICPGPLQIASSSQHAG